MKLTSSASFSPSIRISLRLRIHQAQAKNFCRVLDIRVPQVVYSDPLNPGLFRSSVHLPVQVGFCHRENAVGRLHGVQALDVVLHFFTEENGHLNDTVALDRLWIGDNIPALDTLIIF